MKANVHRVDLHHAHLFASDIEATIVWWQHHLGASILFDGELAGVRNVLLAVGSGRLNIYDQAPRGTERGSIHHLGVRVTDLGAVWARLQADGVTSRHGLREQAGWRYVMVAAPDDVLVELFEFDDPASPLNVDGRR
ncbi:MAG: VOC family protein [Acetobacteraceae bacterium]|nr:VOC family protein [Acetobacteraceae bacterium]MSP29408.1 VOC family protein [Acetobacteraceae bacterium]